MNAPRKNCDGREFAVIASGKCGDVRNQKEKTRNQQLEVTEPGLGHTTSALWGPGNFLQLLADSLPVSGVSVTDTNLPCGQAENAATCNSRPTKPGKRNLITSKQSPVAHTTRRRSKRIVCSFPPTLSPSVAKVWWTRIYCACKRKMENVATCKSRTK